MPAEILSPPTTSKAVVAGYTELVRGSKLGVPINHSGIAITRSYLKDHADVVKSFLVAYLEAWTISADPANESDVVAVLREAATANPDQFFNDSLIDFMSQ